jgi:hypothetical protein
VPLSLVSLPVHWWFSQPYPIPYRNRTPYSEKTHPTPTMPGWPCIEGKRCVTFELPTEHVEHLDAQAIYNGCSRAAYLRQLIVRDIERQGPGRMATA